MVSPCAPCFLPVTNIGLIAFANNTLNEANNCTNSGTSPQSFKAGSTFTSPDVADAVYISTEITNASLLSETSVTFEANVTQSGNYSVLLFTSGCLQDGTCSTRGQVNVTVYAQSGKEPVSTVLYQTNDYDKYDTVYIGDVESISSGFRPRLVLEPLLDQPVPLTFVANQVEFVINSISESIQLNAIFEYDPSNFTDSNTKNLPVGNTTFNHAGSLLNTGAVVLSMYSGPNSSVLVAGDFNSSILGDNVFLVDEQGNSTGFASIPGEGLNQAVSQITYAASDVALLVGNFTANKNNTVQGLNRIAGYNFTSNNWVAYGKGTNGPVDLAVNLALNGTSNIAFSGNFSSIQDSHGSTLETPDGFAIWNNDANNWIQETPLSTLLVEGRLSTSVAFNSTTNLYGGSLLFFSNSAPGSAFIDSNFNLFSPPFEVVSSTSSSNNSSLSARATILQSNGSAVNTGAFANSSLSILGGHFIARGENSSDLIHNLLFVNEDTNDVSGLPGGIDEISTIYSLLVTDSDLYVGGSIVGSVDQDTISGLFFYNLSGNAFSSSQPPGISGGQAIVTDMAIRPNTNQLVVVGSFEQAGSLSCNAFCIYDLEGTRWNSPTPGLDGLISTMSFLDNDIVLFAGDMHINDTDFNFVQYDFSTSSYQTFGEVSTGLPGPVNSFVLNGESLQSVFASGVDSSTGNMYVAHWNNSVWTRLDEPLLPGSVVSELTILQLSSPHRSNNVLPSDEVLMVSGNLILEEFGNASSVLFDGSNWQPLFITSGDSGSSGNINSFFSQSSRSFSTLTSRHHMKKGFVVLIALAISLGIVFLVVLLGLLIAYLRRRRQGYAPAPTRVSEVDMAQSIPPATLFEEMGSLGPRRRLHSLNG